MMDTVGKVFVGTLSALLVWGYLFMQPSSATYGNCNGSGGATCQFFAIPVTQTIAAGTNQIPTCGAPTQGLRAFVTDHSNTVTYHATAVGGGTTGIWITCDGANWVQG